MKLCSKCKKNFEDFEFKKPTICKYCYNNYMRIYMRNYYKKNKHKWKKRQISEKQKQYKLEYRQKLKQFVNNQKTPCVVCGESEKICIDFHHKDPSKKLFDFCFSRTSCKKDILLKEIEKCICLCGNCHRLVGAGWIKLNETM